MYLVGRVLGSTAEIAPGINLLPYSVFQVCVVVGYYAALLYAGMKSFAEKDLQ